MANEPPIRLLILDSSKNRAEELIVLLRNSGRATRAQAVESHESLQVLLKSQPWDLFLARSAANDVTAEQAIALIKEFEKDVPFILLSDGDDWHAVTEGLKAGASDVALEGDPERLIAIIRRELANLEVRRQMRRLELELKEAKKRYELLLESSQAAVAYIHDGMHIFANEAYLKLFGYEDFDELEVLPIIDLIDASCKEDFKRFLKNYGQEGEQGMDFTCLTSDGHRLQAKLILSSAQYEGEPCTQVIFRVGGQVQPSQIPSTAGEVSPSGLLNRRQFSECLDQAIDQAVQHGTTSVLCYILLDNFSHLIGEAGIDGTDQMVDELAQFLRQHTGENHTLARFLDDVFVLILNNTHKEEALEFAENLRAAVAAQLWERNQRTYHMTVSIGMALIGEAEPNPSEVIGRCHRAVAEKPEGNHVSFHQPKQAALTATGAAAEAQSDAHLRKLLASAFENSRFKLLFQPIISLHSEEDEQFEVLIRLIDDDGNELLPGKFLDLARQEGLAEKLDRWIILQSIKHLAAHRQEGFQTRLFINVTAATLQDESFLPWIGVALRAAKLPTDAVILQFHESDAFTYLKHASKFTKQLRVMHCKASINHFGCSLNPMNSLQHLQVDYAKLDGSFAQAIDTNEAKRKELVTTIKALQSRGILTAISGVESPTVLSTLWEAGVNFVQGNVLSEPLESMDYDFSSEDM